MTGLAVDQEDLALYLLLSHHPLRGLCRHLPVPHTTELQWGDGPSSLVLGHISIYLAWGTGVLRGPELWKWVRTHPEAVTQSDTWYNECLSRRDQSQVWPCLVAVMRWWMKQSWEALFHTPVPWSTLNAPFLCVTLCVLSHRKTALWIIYSVTTLYIFKVCTFN